MTNDNNIFTLRFYGNDVHPSSFSLKELGELLVSIEEGVKSIIENSYPGADSETVNLALTSIVDKSNSLGIETSNDITNTGILDFAKSISENKYTNLPPKAYKSYRDIHKLVESKQCESELVYKGNILYVVTPETKIIKQESVIVDLDSIIYGEILKLGSSSTESTKSRIWINLLDGRTISFSVPKEQAVELSPKLFQTVALKGKIRWNVLTKTTIGFKLFEILNYKQGNISKGFEQLRNITSGFWDTLKSDSEITNYLKGE